MVVSFKIPSDTRGPSEPVLSILPFPSVCPAADLLQINNFCLLCSLLDYFLHQTLYLESSSCSQFQQYHKVSIMILIYRYGYRGPAIPDSKLWLIAEGMLEPALGAGILADVFCDGAEKWPSLWRSVLAGVDWGGGVGKAWLL